MSSIKTNFYFRLLLLLSIQCIVWGCKTKENAPQKDQWTVTASSSQEERLKPSNAVNTDLSSRWSSNWSDEQWLEINTNENFNFTGLQIIWESAYAKSFETLTSVDGDKWEKGYATKQGEGGIQDIFTTPRKAKYVKINLHTRATGWGFSILDISLKGTSAAPLIKENDVVVKDVINLLDGNSNTEWISSSENESELVLNFLKSIEIGGIRLDWGANYAQDLDYFTSLDGKDWEKTSEIKEGLGNFEILKHQKKKLQYVKLVLKNSITKNKSFTIKDITLYGPNKQLSNLVKYEILAQKMPLGLYPTQLKNRQVYWTLLGVSNDTEESLFDEYGNIEPYAGAPTLMPVLKINGKLLTALDATLFFVIHPVQINPKWQHSGLSLIHKLKIDNTHQPKIYVNDKTLYILIKKK